MNLDSSIEAFRSIIQDVEQNAGSQITSEEDSKVRIITRVLTEVLGWNFSDIGSERKHDSGFSDYLVSNVGEPEFVLEAKRLGILEIETKKRSEVRRLKISGPALRGSVDGIQQAARYANDLGLPLAVVSDGFNWIVFKPLIPKKDYKEFECFVFPSLEAIESDFAIFYELLAKEAVVENLHRAYFDNLHETRLEFTRSLKAAVEPSDIKLLQRGTLSSDLDSVFAKFFSKLTGADDANMLVECFVESNESRIADFALEKITAKILGEISNPPQGVASELNQLIESAVAVDRGQTVFLVGPTGAGKSTFLERFFSKTLPNSLRQRCLVMRINCLDSTGNDETFQTWMTEALISAIQSQIYMDGHPTYDELRGLYHSEYLRRSRGVWSHTYKRDKDEFKEKFGDFLEEQISAGREDYLFKLLKDLVVNRKRMPIIVVDNTDEFPLKYKEELFQFVHAIRRHANYGLLIFPLTDKSAWTLSKTDIYGIYTPRSFFLPTPSPREVFRKRIAYIQKILAESRDKASRGRYLTSQGISISVPDLGKFAEILEYVFVNQDYTSKMIGQLSNYNIRRTLDLSRRVMTSPVFDVETLVASYVTGKSISDNFYKFMNALLKGNHEFYRYPDHEVLHPIFNINGKYDLSPLLKLRILKLLKERLDSATSVDEKHMKVSSIVSYFDACGVPELYTEETLVTLLESQLVEPFDATSRNINSSLLIALTVSGSTHLRLACENTVFFEQLALTTPITDHDLASRIIDVYRSERDYFERLAIVRNLFVEYLVREDRSRFSFPASQIQYESQARLADELQATFKTEISESSESQPDLATGPELVEEGVFAVVDRFLVGNGYGFVNIENGETGVFIHAEVLKNNNETYSISDGDKLLCDVSRGEKGLFVSAVYDHEIDMDITTSSCSIVRIFPEREYGFVSVSAIGDDAFFHFSVFEPADINKLTDGFIFNAEVKRSAGSSTAGYQIRRVLSIT